jgi:hypothetical protein
MEFSADYGERALPVIRRGRQHHLAVFMSDLFNGEQRMAVQGLSCLCLPIDTEEKKQNPRPCGGMLSFRRNFAALSAPMTNGHV